jgi:hypothetical protein
VATQGADQLAADVAQVRGALAHRALSIAANTPS